LGSNAQAPGTLSRWRLKDLVTRLGGDLVGDGDTVVHRVSTLLSAGPGDIAFLSHPRYWPQLETSRASALILPRGLQYSPVVPSIVCDDPYLYYAEVSRLLSPQDPVVPGCHPGAVIELDAAVSAAAQVAAGAYIGHRASIGPGTLVGYGCYVGDEVAIGRDSRLYPNATVYQGCIIGERAIIHSGAVIGADGFGMALKNGHWLKIPQLGKVVIGDDVEIGANTCIDRGALDDTVIESGVKLDNLIQVGHNVHIGSDTAVAGCVGIAGSARIGRHCTIGGAANILGHLEIADHVNVSAATLITTSIAKAGTYTGIYPFDEHGRWGRTAASLRQLDDLVSRIRKLEAGVRAKARRAAVPGRTVKSKKGQ
jgi:UDP-3-O-[3-hydroxymyristoyl] glucosamine N-acyltransferase